MNNPNARLDTSDWTRLEAAGLIQIGTGCRISPLARFEPQDETDQIRPITIADNVRIGAGAVIHGGTRIATGVRVEDNVTIGQPEEGYAVGRTYTGTGATTLAEGTALRSGAILYAGVSIGAETTIGHRTLIRSHTTMARTATSDTDWSSSAPAPSGTGSGARPCPTSPRASSPKTGCSSARGSAPSTTST
ncbi:hypothetical protein [Streptomyces sp. HUAS TT20]|uniref:hypothetical protein n=1 Tax=Streptomyces sp. HUAS TT20 TaxID=3447509 RepID=UPI0021DB42FD|nr:hypothetical protein [Streptomyces sp. HUAS 15-9]UXY32189.1 hypothetical protein N8I87_40440 [Streptomyces sp. HUAS 15-9]